MEVDPIFGLEMVTRCPGVPDDILIPRNTWDDPANFDRTSHKLADLFKENFAQFESEVDQDVRAAGPK